MANFFTGFLARGTVSGGVFTEETGAGYARQAITYGAMAGAVAAPSSGVTFGPATAAWSAATARALFDTAGNIVAYFPMPAPLAVAINGQDTPASVDLTLTVPDIIHETTSAAALPFLPGASFASVPAGPVIAAGNVTISGGVLANALLLPTSMRAGAVLGLGLSSTVRNIGNTYLPRWRAAMARVRAGTGRGRLLTCGDSTSMGAGAGSGGTLNENGAYPKAWPQALAGMSGAITGVPFSSKAIMGNQAAAVAYGTYDTRVTLGTGWSGTQGSLGGNMFKFTAGVAGTLSFTPVGTFDTILVYYVQTGPGATGTMAVNVDGGATIQTLTAANAVATYAVATLSVTLATHTINFVASNLGDFFLGGVIAYNSTAVAVDFVQAGFAGATASNFVGTTNVWSPQNVITSLAPDLTIIELTVNDSNNGTALATYQANMQAIIASAQVSGDVILMTGPPSSTTAATNGTLDQYIAVLDALAVANGCVLIDTKARWGSYAAINPIMAYFDSLHPGAVAYQDMAQSILNVLRGA